MMVLAFCFMGSNVFAADLASASVSATGGGTLGASAPATADICRFSNNVKVGAVYSGTGYALTTYHSRGTKMYGTAYDSTALFFLDIGVDGDFVAPASSDSQIAFEDPGTWTKM